ncbi:MAG: hypothetical protein AABY95_11695 [Pseudomonadota bacterium]
MPLRKIILAASLILAVPVVYADVCIVPGDIVVEDAVSDPVAATPTPSNPVTDVADVVSLSVATPAAASIDEQTVVFTLATSGTAPALPPGSGYFASFADPRQTIRGVRLEGSGGGFTYYSYVAAANSDGITSGRLIEDGSQKPAEGSYAGNVVTITVKAKDIGLRDAGDTLSGFNGGSLVLVGASGVASQAQGIDNMPNDLNDRAAAMPVTYSLCKKSAEARAAAVEDKSGTSFGGAFSLMNLLLMLPMLSRYRL